MSMTTSRQWARWLLRECGVSVPRVGRPKALSAAQELEVLDGFDRGETWNSLAAQHRVSLQTIWRIWRRAQRAKPVVAPRGTLRLRRQTSLSAIVE